MMAIIPALTIAVALIRVIVMLIDWLHAHPEITTEAKAALTTAKTALTTAHDAIEPHTIPVPPEAP